MNSLLGILLVTPHYSQSSQNSIEFHSISQAFNEPPIVVILARSIPTRRPICLSYRTHEEIFNPQEGGYFQEDNLHWLAWRTKLETKKNIESHFKCKFGCHLKVFPKYATEMLKAESQVHTGERCVPCPPPERPHSKGGVFVCIWTPGEIVGEMREIPSSFWLFESGHFACFADDS